MRVEILNRQRGRRVATGPLVAFLGEVARKAPAPSPSSLTVCLVSDRAMRVLNRDWRGFPSTTDVLSFPAGDPEEPGGAVHLGDIVISVEQAARQARRGGRSLSRELRVLLLHGWLHLLGYDHETDDGSMMRLQRRLERQLFRASGSTR